MTRIDEKRRDFWKYYTREIRKDLELQFQKGPQPFKDASSTIYEGIINTLVVHLDIILSPTIVAYIHEKKTEDPNKESIYDSLFSGDHAATLTTLESFHSQTIINILNRFRRFKFHFFQVTNRFFKDWEALKKLGGIKEEDVLSEVRLTCGDEHFQGAQTSIFRFSDNKKGIVYKPVNINMDLLMELLQQKTKQWQGEETNFSNILSKSDGLGNYGYIGLYEYKGDVTSLEEAQKVYYEFGKLLAWGKFFKIVDGHCDNIIVKVPNVYWIDLETAFHFMHDTVYEVHPLEETGLIYEAQEENTYIGIITGIQGGGMPRLGLTSPTVYEDGTDNMFIRYFRTFYPSTITNRIYLNKQLCKPEDFSESIKQGYRDSLKFLCSHKQKIIQIILEFTSKHILKSRFLIQTTACYTRFIGLLNHVIACRNNDIMHKIRSERENTIIGSEEAIKGFILENEFLDIVNGIVPYFYRTSQDNSLFHSSGASREDFFSKSLLSEIQTHILSISGQEKDLDSDCEFIDRALNSTAGIETFEDFKKKLNFQVFDFESQVKGT